MQCWGTRHLWTWSASTTADEMPLSLRCACGALTREQAVSIVVPLRVEPAGPVERDQSPHERETGTMSE